MVLGDRGMTVAAGNCIESSHKTGAVAASGNRHCDERLSTDMTVGERDARPQPDGVAQPNRPNGIRSRQASVPRSE
jgi:hypothetical protein